MLQDARIDQLIMDFARLDPTADGVLTTREFSAALAKHGIEPHRIDALVFKFKKRHSAGFGESSFSDFPTGFSDTVDYVKFLAFMEETAQNSQQEKLFSPNSSSTAAAAAGPSLHPGARSFSSSLSQRGAMMPRDSNVQQQQQQQQQPPQPQKKSFHAGPSFIDRALSNASRAILSHNSTENAALSSTGGFVSPNVMQAANTGWSFSTEQHQHQQQQQTSFQELVDQVSSLPNSAVAAATMSPTPKKQQQQQQQYPFDTSVALSPLTPGSFLQPQQQQQQQPSSGGNTPVPEAAKRLLGGLDDTTLSSTNSHSGILQAASSSAGKVSLPFIFTRLDRDGDGHVTIDDLLRCASPPLFGRLELEVLMESVLMARSSGNGSGSDPADFSSFDVSSARLNIDQFSILFSRMKPACIAALRDPETWNTTKRNGRQHQHRHEEKKQTQQEVAVSQLDQHRRARWSQNQKSTTPPPVQQQQQQFQDPSPVSFNPSPRHETPPKPVFIARQQHHEQQQQRQKQQPMKQQHHPVTAVVVEKKKPVSSFMRPTTSSSLRTGKLSNDVETVRRSVSEQHRNSSSPRSSSGSAMGQNHQHRKTKSGAINLRGGNEGKRSVSATARVSPQASGSSSSSRNRNQNRSLNKEKQEVVHHHESSPSVERPAGAAQSDNTANSAAIDPAVAALFRGKATHIMNLCRIVDRARTGHVPASRLVEILQNVHHTVPEEELELAVAAAKHHFNAKLRQNVVDYGDFVRVVVVSSAAAAPPPAAGVSPQQHKHFQQEQNFSSESPSPRPAAATSKNANAGLDAEVSPASSRQSPATTPQQSRGQRAENGEASNSSATIMAAATDDASNTLRQMLRTELDRATKSTPQVFIDCLLSASKGSKEHRTKNIWMVRCSELYEALSLVYGAAYTPAVSPGRGAADSPSSNNNNKIYSTPPDWVVTRARKIGQTPFHHAATTNSLSCSPKAKQCRRRAHDWLLSNPNLKAEEWCDAAFLLETLYLE